MKVLHVLWSGRIGGIERVVYDLACAQRRAGIQVGLLMGQAEGEFYQKAMVSGIPVVNLQLRSGFDIAAMAVSRSYQTMKQIDIIHYHGFLPVAALAGIVARRPLVYSDHGHDVTHQLTFTQSVKQRLQTLFVRHAINKIAANSDYTRQLASKVFHIPLDQIAVIHNGIDFETIRPFQTKTDTRTTLQIPTDATVIGTVCRLATFKRVDRLLESFALLPPGPQDYLLIIGDGPAASALREQAQKLGIAGKVVFAGFREDIGNMLQAMDMFVLPSQGEPFGIAVLEALAAGLPVFTFADVGGTTEIVTTPPVTTPQEMATTLAQQIKSGKGEKTAVTPFHINHMATQFTNLYKELLHNHATALA